MKKITCLVGSLALLSASIAHAADQSATIDIEGTVSGFGSGTASCTVTDSAAGAPVLLSSNDMIDQGSQETNAAKKVTLSVVGTKNASDCYNDVMAGRINLKVRGQADNAGGSSLANTATDSPATGVAIGLYNYNAKNSIHINDATLPLVPGNGSFELGLQMVKLPGQTVTDGNVKGLLTVDIVRL